MPPIPNKQPTPPDPKGRIAINLFDLDAMDAGLRIMLFGNRLNLKSPIRVDPKNISETAIEITGQLITAASALDIVQSERRKLGENPAKIYANRSGNWVRLPSTILLTVLKDGKASLNHQVFGADVLDATKVERLRPARINL